MSGNLSGLQSHIFEKTGIDISPNEIPDLLRKIKITAEQQILENQENEDDDDEPPRERAWEKAQALSRALSVDNSIYYLMDGPWDWNTLDFTDRNYVAAAAVVQVRKDNNLDEGGIRDGGARKKKKSRRRKKLRRKLTKKRRKVTKKCCKKRSKKRSKYKRKTRRR